MNERLEKEINRRMQYWTEGWKDESGHFHNATGLHCGGERATFDDLTELIQHFYNFALQDIREIVETGKENEEELRHIANQEQNLTDFIKYCNRIPVYNEILECIDALMEESKS